jgi:LmbE family N-acetylglucosaminyl deacetylase
MTSATRLLRLMAILAHPDDESLGLGGVLARYAAEGVEITVLTATRGEGGRFRGEREGPHHPGPEALARIREAELRAATRVLGAGDPILLGYRDGALDRADPREAVARIAAHLRSVRPDVVLTFAPDGAYGHPDHIAISQFAGAAIVAAADPHADFTPALRAGGGAGAHVGVDGRGAGGEPHAVAKFYYIAWPESAWHAYQSAFKKLVSVVDGVERQAQPWPEWSITTVIDTSAHWETAWKAVSCHESQITSYERLRQLSPDEHAALWGHQSFYRVFSTVNGGRARETDLFEGLRG